MKYAIGIDLGTCNSAVTHINSSGNSEIIKNDDGDALTPSVVNFSSDGRTYIGRSAQRVLDHEPESTFARFKRHMGTRKQYPTSGTEYDSTELSAILLEKLAADALSELRRSDPGAKIAKAVITVPAEFSTAARSATVAAAEAAGIEVDDLIAEPTAAILYHQHCLKGRSDINGIYVVVDLGGGTLDVSVVSVDGDTFTVPCSIGSVEIGGIDFDRKLQQLVQTKFANDSGELILDIDDYTLSKSEEDKKLLSEKPSQLIRVSGHHTTNHRKIKRTIEITRSEFEDAIQGQINTIRDKCLQAMEMSAISPDDIRDVILVGGSTRVPSVKRIVDEVFETNSLRSKDCDEAVARGAGIFAASRSIRNAEIPFNDFQRTAVGHIELAEVLHKSYGIISRDISNKFAITFMLTRGTPVPCSEERQFFLPYRDISSKRSRIVEWKIVESDDGDEDPQSASNRSIQTETLDIRTHIEGQEVTKERVLIANIRCNLNKVLESEFVDKLTGDRSVGRPIPLDEIGETT